MESNCKTNNSKKQEIAIYIYSSSTLRLFSLSPHSFFVFVIFIISITL